MKKGFTLIELLVVVAIVALLLAIIMPVLGKAREGARVTAVGAELYTIGLALEAYGLDNEEKFPPTRASCMILSHFHQLPDELVAGKYLPERPKKYGPMSTAFEDRFNPDHTYKYHAAGDLIMNMGSRAMKNRSKLWVPDGFPEVEKEDGAFYNNPKTSPVTWVVYSQGPNFDENDHTIMSMRYPVPSSTWYNPSERKGCITRIRLIKGRHVGSF
ncbi:MAG: type II secretion system protein [Sedimentisphaerales bacterium]|nr:type II secretion system protein [Sedimentisphaerales bacterium]